MVGCRGGRRVAAALALCPLVFLTAACGVAASPSASQESTSRTFANPGLPAGSARRALAKRYLVIAEAGNRRLEHDFDPLEDRDRNDLARARADLRDAAATERLFDRRLLRIPFAPQTERVARDLYTVNQARASLTIVAASSPTLELLHSYDGVLDAANRPVERLVGTIRRQLGLPLPSTS